MRPEFTLSHTWVGDNWIGNLFPRLLGGDSTVESPWTWGWFSVALWWPKRGNQKCYDKPWAIGQSVLQNNIGPNLGQISSHNVLGGKGSSGLHSVYVCTRQKRAVDSGLHKVYGGALTRCEPRYVCQLLRLLWEWSPMPTLAGKEVWLCSRQL